MEGERNEGRKKRGREKVVEVEAEERNEYNKWIYPEEINLSFIFRALATFSFAFDSKELNQCNPPSVLKPDDTSDLS